jgi:hypothetical protein
MTLIEQCLDQVGAVRQAAADPKAAYVIRSRLERLMLSCARLTSSSRVASPDIPGITKAQASSDVEDIAAACDKLFELSASICRPSESLDVRWDEGWSRISPALAELERLLIDERGKALAT